MESHLKSQRVYCRIHGRKNHTGMRRRSLLTLQIETKTRTAGYSPRQDWRHDQRERYIEERVAGRLSQRELRPRDSR
ncbi:hypothetical protein J6590_010590 [Homalodisca vitripennis]|nr:hypothetical protein J6590_010590 [Homalodisca vitripennis]